MIPSTFLSNASVDELIDAARSAERIAASPRLAYGVVKDAADDFETIVDELATRDDDDARAFVVERR